MFLLIQYVQVIKQEIKWLFKEEKNYFLNVSNATSTAMILLEAQTAVKLN